MRRFRDFARHHPRVERMLIGESVGIRKAIVSLGREKVLPFLRVARAFSLFEKRDFALIRQVAAIARVYYSEATLEECAEENRKGRADWRLVYVCGLSLRELLEMFGTTPDPLRLVTTERPCFFNTDWCHQPEAEPWATARAAPGYRLLDLNPRFLGSGWHEQEIEIGKLEACERAPEAAVAEAVFAAMLVRDERLLAEPYHWGPGIDATGGRIYVGRNDTAGKGLVVGSYRPDWRPQPDFGACLLRVPTSRFA